ncbi:MAG: biotin--[acetyl-CoA-carboxylase] ligase [Paludibacteraceae bacterium]|nr:biotin--[acetyl-CoA-carboxylase] ligase [Paludibacteraceae bacterium]
MKKADIFCIEETTSTNQLLWQLATEKNLPEGTVVHTYFQTNGRGQGSNTWESEKGKNLLFSMLLFPKNIAITQQFLLSEIVALAIKDVLQKELNRTVKIKWPNDIYVEDKKIAGILIENKVMGNKFSSSVIGIGLNVNQTHFFSNAPNPISMKLLSNNNFNIEEIMVTIHSRILEYYESIGFDARTLQESYFNSLYRNDDFYAYKNCKGELFIAKITQVLPSGQLVLVDSNNNTHTYSFKEVEFIIEKNI